MSLTGKFSPFAEKLYMRFVFFPNFPIKNTMKRTIQYLLLSAVAVFFLSSCVFEFLEGISGNGKVVTETRNVSDFKSIQASTGLHVYITFGKEYAVTVEADENLHEVIKTVVSSGNLRIYSEKNIRNAAAKNINVTVPALEEIEVSSAADVRGQNAFEADQLRINVSSAGELRLETHAKEIRADASSSGRMELRGDVKDFKCNVSSAGSIDADELVAKNVDVSASSAGNASVWAQDELRADASSAGSIRYKGEPTAKKIDTSSAGSITQR
jgi:hypothetical protein